MPTAESYPKEIKRLKMMIEYALGAPERDSIRILLVDALCGCNGSDNYEAIRKTKKWKKLSKIYLKERRRT